MRRSDVIFRHRVRNWPEYNRALIACGSLTLWVDEQAVSARRQRGGPRGRGRLRIYSDTAIECALVVRSVFHLSLRATQGFLDSVVRLMGVDLPVPAYSTVSRRQAGLELRLQAAPKKRPRQPVREGAEAGATPTRAQMSVKRCVCAAFSTSTSAAVCAAARRFVCLPRSPTRG